MEPGRIAGMLRVVPAGAGVGGGGTRLARVVLVVVVASAGMSRCTRLTTTLAQTCSSPPHCLFIFLFGILRATTHNQAIHHS